jgi:hypothetical protein
MTKKFLMIAFPAVLATMMLLGSVTGASLNQEVFAAKGGNEKVDICHNTNSAKNPLVTINVSVNAIPAHLSHGDFVGTCEDGPDCEHESNAENPACVTEPEPCEDCQNAYAEAVAVCDPDDINCLQFAREGFLVCRANNGIPECTDPTLLTCEDCQNRYLAEIEFCPNDLCVFLAGLNRAECLGENEIDPSSCPSPVG